MHPASTIRMGQHRISDLHHEAVAGARRAEARRAVPAAQNRLAIPASGLRALAFRRLAARFAI